MNTFEIIISVGILLLLVIFIFILIEGPNTNYNIKQESMKGRVHKYSPLIIVAALFITIISAYIFYTYKDRKKAETYSNIKEIYERKSAEIDSILETKSMDSATVADMIKDDLDSLVIQKKRLEELQEESKTQTKFLGKTKTLDSIQILDRDYEKKFKYLEKNKRVKVYRAEQKKEDIK